MFFGHILEAGKQYEQEPDLALHLSMATVVPDPSDKSVVSLYLHAEDKKYLICSLCPANLFQVPLDLTFIEGQTVLLSSEGNISVHLTGYYMPEQDFDDFDDEELDESESDLEDEEEDEQVESDVKVKQEKRSAESPTKAIAPVAKKVKSEPTANQKPAVNGQPRKPVPVTRAEDDDDDDDDEDGSEDGDDSDDSETDLNALLAGIKKAKESDQASKKKPGQQKESGSGDQSNVSAEDDQFEDDDDDDDDEDDDEDMDEDESDDMDDDLSAQQKQIKQKLQQKGAGKQQSKPQNGQSGGKGGQQNQGKQTFGKQNQQPHQSGGNQNQQKGGGFKGTPGNKNKFQSPGSGFRGQGSGNKRGGFAGGRGGGGRGGGRGGVAGGTPFNKNKNKNFSPHQQKQGNRN